MPKTVKEINGQVAFGSVVHLCTARSKDPAADGLDRFIGLEHLDPSDLRIRRWGRVEDGTTFTNRFSSGQVLFGKRRAYQRKVGVADFEGVCSGDIYVFEPKDPAVFLPGLLPFVCQTESFFEYAVGTSAGSLSPRTDWKHLVRYRLALPTPGEQKRSLKALQAVEANLRAAQDLLDATIEARESLTQWYATAGGQPLAEDGTVPLTELPSEWSRKSLADLCAGAGTALGIGPFGSDLVAKDYAHTEGTPVVFVADVVRHQFQYTSEKYVTAEKHAQLAAHEALTGDVLVTKMGWPPGEACVVPDDFGPAVVTADVIRIRANSDLVVNHYLAAILNSHWGQQQIVRVSPGTTRPKTTLRDFSKIHVALPPRPAQDEATAELLAVQDQVEMLQARVEAARDIKTSVLQELLGG